ncbi:MAG TPA: hypothetical protein VFG69_12420 [Nannocystaceae bacterium]|nr:hypothetical protein [Nannocystaceae bacterium]
MLRSAFAASLLAVVPFVACDDAPRSSPPPEPAPVAARTGSPLGELTPARSDEPWLGVVETRLAAGSYTYLAVRDATALRWVATTGAGVPEGSPVSVRSYGTRKDFYSRRLDRSFAELEFGMIEAVGSIAGEKE